MKKNIKFSLVIPAYNIEKYILDCVNSIVKQTETMICKYDVEIIIINDGSSDNTSNLIHRYYDQDSFIKIVDQKNQGLSATRNNGLKIASGDYVWFVDGDDCIADNSLEKLFDFCVECMSDLVVFNADTFNNYYSEHFFNLNISENIINSKPSEVLKKLLKDDYSFGWCVWHYIFRREFLVNNNLYFEEGKISEDVGFTFDVFLFSKNISCLKSKSIYLYRSSNDLSITHQANISFSKDILYFVERNLKKISEFNDDELSDLLKLNYQTLIEVVLFWFSSYNSVEKKLILNDFNKINDLYLLKINDNKTIKKKEKYVSLFIKIFGFRILGEFWGVKRNLYCHMRRKK